MTAGLVCREVRCGLWQRGQLCAVVHGTMAIVVEGEVKPGSVGGDKAVGVVDAALSTPTRYFLPSVSLQAVTQTRSPDSL